MNVKARKAFFNDLTKIADKEIIQQAEFVFDYANDCETPEEIPGFKKLHHYSGFRRIEISPYRIGVEITGGTIIFKRILHRSSIYKQFP